jgi:hypothetical protein
VCKLKNTVLNGLNIAESKSAAFTEERKKARQERMSFDCTRHDTFTEEPTKLKFLSKHGRWSKDHRCIRGRRVVEHNLIKLFHQVQSQHRTCRNVRRSRRRYQRHKTARKQVPSFQAITIRKREKNSKSKLLRVFVSNVSRGACRPQTAKQFQQP